MFRHLLDLLAPAIEAQRTWDEAIAIHRLDRQFTSSAFHESARFTAQRMREAGLQGVKIVEAPADGTSVFGDWKMPLAWEVGEATFDLLSPDGRSERLADRAHGPLCLAMWSGPTPPEGVEAEIVIVPDPAQAAPGSLRGKIAFIATHPHAAKRALARAGAVGLLTDYLHPGAEAPEATAWINSFSDDPNGWAFHAGDTPLWSFQLSPRAGEQVRARLRTGGTYRGRALVRSELKAGTLPVITGVVPGTGPEEVVLVGHQFEVGAIDNASGVAAMLEALRAIQSLVDRGALPQPQRSIRLLAVSECYTNLYWWETTRGHRGTVAGLCLDSPVGAPEYARRPMELHLDPHAQSSYTDALLVHLVDQVMAASPMYAWRETGYAMTDNLIADTSINIPCPWIGGHSRTWHTSADTADKLPVRELGLSAQLTAAYAYLIASADAALALDFAHLAAMRGKQVLAAAGVAEAARGDLDEGMQQLDYLAARQADAVESVLRLVPRGERAALRTGLRPLARELRRQGKEEAAALARRAGQPGHAPAGPPSDAALEEIRPRRLVLGPLCFDRLPEAVRAQHASPRWSSAVFSLLCWCDGKRSLGEAARLAARELREDRALGPDEFAKLIDPAAPSLLGYFEFLRQCGYVTW